VTMIVALLTAQPALAAVAGSPITINLVMALTVGVLYAVGFTLLLSRSLMRVLIGVVVLGHGTNLLLQLAGGPPARPPIVGTAPPESFADPLPQALALTAIVITFALTTFLLALGYRAFVLVGHDEVQDDVEDRRISRQKELSAPLDVGDEEGGLERADDEVEAEAARGQERP
jgi:multicomponent Na+:H+ antiporter subunit C